MKYTIEFVSDWHIGSGQGRHGDADALVVRDSDDLPFVPGKTITGIWRDACEQIAGGLDGKPDGDWSAWVEWLFGSQPALDGAADRHDRVPIPAHVSIRSARMPKELREALTQSAFAPHKQALTWLKPGVEIDPEQGWAREEQLRFEEVVRPRIHLDGTVDMETEDSMPDPAKALLWAGARIVERIGGKRRRGLGRCNLTIEAEAEKHLQVLQKPPGRPAINPPGLAAKTTQDMNAVDGHGNWVEVPLVLHLDLPVVVSQQTLGNVVTCRNEIPGTLLLGPVLRCLNPDRLHFYHDVAAGRLQVLDATPEVVSSRALPIPMVLFSPKDNVGVDSTQPKLINRLYDLPGKTQLDKCRNRFVGCVDMESKILPLPADPSIFAHTHNTVEDSVQRPTEAVGGVYTYEALAANTRWRTTLRLHPDLASRLEKTLPDWRARLGTESSRVSIKLGVAKKADYGLASTWVTNERSSDDLVGNTDRVIVWLTSDLLLRDARQQPTVNITVLAVALGNLLGGVNLKPEPTMPGALTAVARHSRRDGWHFHWGRPRPSLIGFAAGSCFVFKADRKLSAAALKTAQDKGLGDRRAEGFGQLRLNTPWLMGTLAGWTAKQNKRFDEPESSVTLETSLTRHLDRIVFERWIDQSAELFAGDSARRGDLKWQAGKPGNSQLGNLRQVLSLVRSSQDIATLREWAQALRHLPQNHRRKEHWSAESINALINLSNNPDDVWNWLAHVSALPPLLSGGGQSAIAALRAQRQHYALRTLLTACIRAEIKQREPH